MRSFSHIFFFSLTWQKKKKSTINIVTKLHDRLGCACFQKGRCPVGHKVKLGQSPEDSKQEWPVEKNTQSESVQ